MSSQGMNSAPTIGQTGNLIISSQAFILAPNLSLSGIFQQSEVPGSLPRSEGKKSSWGSLLSQRATSSEEALLLSWVNHALSSSHCDFS